MSFICEGGDCISHYNASFKESPTLEEFVQYIITEKSNEWGYINLDKWYNRILEYRRGKIVSTTKEYEDNKDRRIVLRQMDGGWTAMDYTIEFAKDKEDTK